MQRGDGDQRQRQLGDPVAELRDALARPVGREPSVPPQRRPLRRWAGRRAGVRTRSRVSRRPDRSRRLGEDVAQHPHVAGARDADSRLALAQHVGRQQLLDGRLDLGQLVGGRDEGGVGQTRASGASRPRAAARPRAPTARAGARPGRTSPGTSRVAASRPASSGVGVNRKPRPAASHHRWRPSDSTSASRDQAVLGEVPQVPAGHRRRGPDQRRQRRGRARTVAPAGG